LFFDPQGADFTSWLNHFKNEVYRNWIISQAALSSAGHVNLEMTVERDGSMSALRMLSSTASPIQDEAAHTALQSSRFAALPEDYTGARVTMQVTFFYKERPR
jgi:TonB family protein